MLLLKSDNVRLHDGTTVDVLEVWGHARCHAKVKDESGAARFIIAENDVAEVLRRPAIRKSSFIHL